jgi:hypothetical protein
VPNLHFDELTTYIFNKPENRALAGEDQQMELQKLTALYETIKQSKDYRLGRWLVDQNHCAGQKHEELLAVKPLKH